MIWVIFYVLRYDYVIEKSYRNHYVIVDMTGWIGNGRFSLTPFQVYQYLTTRGQSRGFYINFMSILSNSNYPLSQTTNLRLILTSVDLFILIQKLRPNRRSVNPGLLSNLDRFGRPWALVSFFYNSDWLDGPWIPSSPFENSDQIDGPIWTDSPVRGSLYPLFKIRTDSAVHESRLSPLKIRTKSTVRGLLHPPSKIPIKSTVRFGLICPSVGPCIPFLKFGLTRRSVDSCFSLYKHGPNWRSVDPFIPLE